MHKAKEVYNNYIRENNVRRSVPRDQILDIFLKTNSHLTIAEIYDLVKKKYPSIGYATIYRAMKTFCTAGIAEEIDIGDGSIRYEMKFGHAHHDHLICLKCGKFIEAMKPEIERLQDEMAEEHNFLPVHHKLHIFGYCSKCH